MGAILAAFLNVFAGVGLGELADKIFPDKVPAPFKEEQSTSGRWTKLIIYSAVIAVGTIAFRFILRKLKVKI